MKSEKRWFCPEMHGSMAAWQALSAQGFLNEYISRFLAHCTPYPSFSKLLCAPLVVCSMKSKVRKVETNVAREGRKLDPICDETFFQLSSFRPMAKLPKPGQAEATYSSLLHSV